MTEVHTARAWQMDAPGHPLVARSVSISAPGPAEVVIAVSGCGLCHTDLSFLHGGVKPRKEVPLTLGHEITGKVIAAGSGAESFLGCKVLVPSVIPCGACDICLAGRSNACRKQLMPGNDMDGGFASHVKVPARFLSVIDTADFEAWELSIVADAVTTPLQSMERAAVATGDVVVVIGAGGIGTYGVQIAAARGATVVAIDIDPAKLVTIREYGAAATVNATGLDARATRDAARDAAKPLGVRSWGWKVFEMSGTAAGQAAAWELLTFAGTLGFVGFGMEKTPVRLANLMAFDATAFGNWGCHPSLYPEAIKLVVSGRIKVRPFIRRFPLDQINDVLDMARAHRLTERAVLVP
jgi:6-hydroxycyclohex-1-ene-1-carbonyl-CoA dehydrogenase